ncbi:ABC transporter substrate-binding protein [Natranaerobius thermophilus]|uniref:Substrate-binding region of ABC-type glycine betaine transport system n=1 Tax=Natranaerobius thermophilus (strain ATCC BAA-1301 / DSM 18059 / JW/NM-WN-LF) TaxID=457570 RepID=B2A8A8_NATTJ|nr:ABC transporter substrate-binding protein [Natranaerobius thermophilus]ACB84474.1 Substrate-binding region of ABC-type glycine betaine transport system [Natranaerobius thermophilus JW/NM-WN-LF]
MKISKGSKIFFLLGLIVVVVISASVYAINRNNQETLTEVELPIVEWPGVTQKTHVVSEILESLGYQVNINQYALPVILEGLSEGDLDVFTGTWFQTWGTPLKNKLADGSVVHVSTQLEDTNYGPAVPYYVYEAGVTSLADLSEYSEEFNHTYYGLESGNDGNQIMIDAFDNNIYDLGDWKIVESSTAAMIQHVQNYMNNEEWIVFSGWEPHWMNVVLDMRYLDDPEGIWGEDEKVGTIARKGLKDDDPNLYKFFEQFDINNEIQSEWIYEYSRKNRSPNVVAKEWVSENLDLVLEWVDGVHTVDGRDAGEVLKEIYK